MPKKYTGTERRSMKACPFHPELVGKVDALGTQNQTILNNQATYMKTTDDLTKIVTNGLKKRVDEIAESTAQIKLRADTVDAFTWFIELVNGFKDKLVVNVFKLAFYGGLIYFFWTLMGAGGNKVGVKLLERLF
jgi:hypothetical protein